MPELGSFSSVVAGEWGTRGWMPRRTRAGAGAWITQSKASLHGCRGLRGRMPGRSSMYAMAYVHEYPGVGPRISGVTACTPWRTCANTRRRSTNQRRHCMYAMAYLHESAASLHVRHGVRGRIPRRRSTNQRRHCIYAMA
jgi:hypothetical protein